MKHQTLKKIKKFFTIIFVIFQLFVSFAFSQQHTNKNKLPEIGIAGASVLSLDKERKIGDIIMRQLRATQPVIHDPVLIEYINHLGNTLVKNAQNVNFKFQFILLNKKEINAFAFFGGHVAVHSSLITLADNESELAAVLAHEISHVTQRHLARRIEEQQRNRPLTTAGLISGILLAMINPTVGFATLSTSMAATQQMNINYTRSNEKEADRVGITLLANSGFDPQGAPEFFKKLADKYRYASKPPPMLLTHPLTSKRISEARIAAQNYPAVHLAPSLDFELAKARIKARYQGNPKDNISYYLYQLKKQRYVLKVAAKYGLAMSYFEDKQYLQSKKILLHLLKNDDKNLFYVDLLTDVYVQTKRYKKALTMLSPLNLLMPNNQVVALNYANVLLAANKADKAAEILQDFLLVQPNNFIALDLLTSVYAKQQKKSLMHTNKAEIYALLGEYPRAIDELQTAFNYAAKSPLIRKRIKARILQFEDQEAKIKHLK